MSRLSSVQATHLTVEAIADGVVQLRGDQFRAVLGVGSVNFGLREEGEQEAILAGFGGFLNSLTFPIQILVRVLPIDLAPYAAAIERRTADLSEPVAQLAHDHLAYVWRLTRQRTLLEHRFYLVVPAQDAAPLGLNRLFGRGQITVDTMAAHRQLTFRCEEIARQLGRCGLSAHRLADRELAELLYTCWCPEAARVQRLRDDITAHGTPAVGPTPQAEGRL